MRVSPLMLAFGAVWIAADVAWWFIASHYGFSPSPRFDWRSALFNLAMTAVCVCIAILMKRRDEAQDTRKRPNKPVSVE